MDLSSRKAGLFADLRTHVDLHFRGEAHAFLTCQGATPAKARLDAASVGPCAGVRGQRPTRASLASSGFFRMISALIAPARPSHPR
ncbi:uncharacterized protein CMC5_030860 [Chondromyces crocatus]|uniref:Uncharacterized protein n=1 Tax=Chondromyces crocatus TaxID=52 RepID=A0A0K1EDK9_CHOCO|nr:uncharacterized protein CMC5_030860 [Chondromyces crocatus]